MAAGLLRSNMLKFANATRQIFLPVRICKENLSTVDTILLLCLKKSYVSSGVFLIDDLSSYNK